MVGFKIKKAKTFSNFCLWVLLFFSILPIAQATNVTLYNSFAGNLNYVTAGGTLRTNVDGVDSCVVTTGPVSASVSGIPSGATITAAYLYWVGSGVTGDYDVTFNGTNVTADRTFTEAFFLSPTTYDFFSGFENVTSLVSGNGSYSFSNLTVSNGTPWCEVSGVVSGWALVVIYSHPSEDFRVVNVFDGLQQFRGSAITLHPSNFQIPASPINGKFSIISWEGDVGNSADLGGFSEDVKFNSTDLIDSANPLNNQFNSTINTYGTGNTYYGVDIDTYDVSSYLSAGQTTADADYSSGGDLVLLGAEIVSVTNTPVSDLAITKSHVGDFAVNTNGTYTIGVTNNGPSATTGSITVTDTLPTGVTYVSATGTGWSCSFSTPTVTCTRSSVLGSGASAGNITLTVTPGNAAYPSFTNTATVSGVNFDNVSGNNTATDPTTVTGVDLSTSTKSVSDVNGAEPDIGDVLRYTIDIINTTTSPATAVTVTDDIPANVNTFTVVSTPAGSTNSSTGSGTGANSTGYLNITNITVPASSTVSIVFDVTIASGTAPNTAIDNTATITSPVGTGATPAASTIVVSPSLVPVTGTKDIYLATAANALTRVIPTGTTATPTIAGLGGVGTYLLSPVLSGDLTFAAGAVPITLQLTRAGSNTSRTVRVDLDYSNGAGGWISLGFQSQTITVTTIGTYQNYSYSITIASDTTVPAGRDLRFRVTNNTTNAARTIRLRPVVTPNYTRLRPVIKTVVNVNSIIGYSAAYPSVSVPTSFAGASNAYIRAVVSDPFGFADITSGVVTIRNPAGTALVTSAAMTSVAAATNLRTYEYVYAIPQNSLGGNWTATVVAKEGAENTISDTGVDSFQVEQAIPTVDKTSTVISDPINNTTNPKRVPGAVVEYGIVLSNTGRGSPDTNKVIITDVVPTNTIMCVSTTCTGGLNPVRFTNGTPTSSLTFTYATHVTYSNQVGGGAPFTYTPVPDVNGYDANVTGFRVAPAGMMALSSGTPPHPSFTLNFRVKVL